MTNPTPITPGVRKQIHAIAKLSVRLMRRNAQPYQEHQIPSVANIERNLESIYQTFAAQGQRPRYLSWSGVTFDLPAKRVINSVGIFRKT